jgi:hypothetical protein
MNTAATTRAAVDRLPWLRRGLRAGLLNAAAVAGWLDLPGDPESVAAAVRRYGADLEPLAADTPSVTVRMRAGLGHGDTADDRILEVLGASIGGSGEGLTALVCTGDVDPQMLALCIDRLSVGSIVVDAAGVLDQTAVIAVPSRDGPAALRMIEDTLAAIWR